MEFRLDKAWASNSASESTRICSFETNIPKFSGKGNFYLNSVAACQLMVWCPTSGVTTAPAACRPCNAGGPRGSGALVPPPTPQKKIHYSCRLCIVVLMDAVQFTSNCSIAGRGALWPCFAAFAGGPRICSYGVRHCVRLVCSSKWCPARLQNCTWPVSRTNDGTHSTPRDDRCNPRKGDVHWFGLGQLHCRLSATVELRRWGCL